MATVTTNDKHYYNIAKAIRKNAGNDKKYKPSEMSDGVCEAYNKGREDMYKSWWNEISNSERYSYSYGFFEFDFDKIGGFVPPKKLLPIYADNMFCKASGLGKITSEQVDFTNTTNLSKAFYNSDITQIDYFCTYAATNLSNTFGYCYSLHTIDTLYILAKNESRKYTNMFNYATGLKNINEIIGKFKSNISFFASPLTLESAIRVIMALETDQTLSFDKTVTFKSSVWELLDENPPSSLGYDDISSPDWKTYIINEKGWNYS